jgi:hypothetical protein
VSVFTHLVVLVLLFYRLLEIDASPGAVVGETQEDVGSFGRRALRLPVFRDVVRYAAALDF